MQDTNDYTTTTCAPYLVLSREVAHERGNLRDSEEKEGLLRLN